MNRLATPIKIPKGNHPGPKSQAKLGVSVPSTREIDQDPVSLWWRPPVFLLSARKRKGPTGGSQGARLRNPATPPESPWPLGLRGVSATEAPTQKTHPAPYPAGTNKTQPIGPEVFKAARVFFRCFRRPPGSGGRPCKRGSPPQPLDRRWALTGARQDLCFFSYGGGPRVPGLETPLGARGWDPACAVGVFCSGHDIPRRTRPRPPGFWFFAGPWDAGGQLRGGPAEK